jgi:membrane protease YdiL (CAAX protease family)
VASTLTRRLLIVEVGVVLALSLGRSGVYAAVRLAEAATTPGSLSNQQAVLNASLAPGRPWFDLVFQILGLAFGLAPVALAGYLLVRSDDDPRALWSRGPAQTRHDVSAGAIVAALVGTAGVAFYLTAYAVGLNLTVVAEALPDVWWKYPVLLLSALQNALLEEVVVVGYLILRLRQLGVSSSSAIAVSALVRGSYHLYQGIGGFVGNAVMGVLFGFLYVRWGRVAPLVVAHTLLDVGAFIGYAVLAGRVSWIPT